jgi:hypothetical protein
VQRKGKPKADSKDNEDSEGDEDAVETLLKEMDVCRGKAKAKANTWSPPSPS